MTIETKYKINDQVYCSLEAAPTKCIIADIHFVEENGLVKVLYSVCSINERIFGTRFGNELFSSKEELLKSL